MLKQNIVHLLLANGVFVFLTLYIIAGGGAVPFPE